MIDDTSRRRLPPYVSYRTFCNFVDGLRNGVPARIDRSYWGDMFSGSSGNQLVTALRFLSLVDANGVPTGQLRQLVSAKGTQKTDLLKEITSKSFSFLNSLDPQTATYAQLREAFHQTFELGSDVSRKCIKFFVALAGDAGIPLSPFVTKRFRSARNGTATKKVTRKTGTRIVRKAIVPQNVQEIPERIPWDKLLLTKFPAFDPAWSDEVKLNWFKAFDELLKREWTRGER